MGMIGLYIINMATYMLLSLPVYLIIRYIYRYKKEIIFDIKHEILLGLFSIYVIGLASQTIVPTLYFGTYSNTGEFYFEILWTNDFSSVNLVPFRTICTYLGGLSPVSVLNIYGNIFIFAPFGMFIPAIWVKHNNLKSIILLGISISLFIEITQIFVGRSSDIDDVILNAIGVVIGFAFYRVWNKIKTYNKRR